MFPLLYSLVGCIIYGLLFFPALLQIFRGQPLWAERLGLRLPSESVDLWLHAASAGEVQLLYPLIQFLRKKRPKIKIHLSVMTLAGYETAQRNFSFRAFSCACLPLDLKFLMQPLLRRLRPRVLVIAEGEHWPCLLQNAKAQKVPLLLVNGRISSQSYRRLKVFPSLCSFLFGHYTYLFLKSENDRKRYLNLQAAPQKAVVAGDLKFDAPLQIRPPQEIAKIRRKLSLEKEDFMLVAGSTRPPKEEKILIDIFKRLKSKHSRKIKLVLAPRHLQRLASLKKLLSRQGLNFSLYSAQGPKKDCILVDQMGLLSGLYAAADLSFVGGTLSDTGGHNILEPVWAGTPVLFGPDVRNIPDLAEYIVKNNYGAQAANPMQLFSLIDQFISKRRSFKTKSKAKQSSTAAQIIGDSILKLL